MSNSQSENDENYIINNMQRIKILHTSIATETVKEVFGFATDMAFQNNSDVIINEKDSGFVKRIQNRIVTEIP